jgi:hypothetical protein
MGNGHAPGTATGLDTVGADAAVFIFCGFRGLLCRAADLAVFFFVVFFFAAFLTAGFLAGFFLAAFAVLTAFLITLRLAADFPAAGFFLRTGALRADFFFATFFAFAMVASDYIHDSGRQSREYTAESTAASRTNAAARHLCSRGCDTTHRDPDARRPPRLPHGKWDRPPP